MQQHAKSGGQVDGETRPWSPIRDGCPRDHPRGIAAGAAGAATPSLVQGAAAAANSLAFATNAGTPVHRA